MKLKDIVIIIAIWEFIIILISLFASIWLPLRSSDIYLGGGVTRYLQNPLLNFRSNFDGVHYVLISTHGYNFGQQAFFPLYPKLIKFFSGIFSEPIFTGVYISTTTFVIGLWFLYKLIILDYSKKISALSIILIVIFPTSFFFTSVYTEGLFFMLVVMCFYFARKNHWLLAGLLGFLAAYTRFIGIFLFPALLVELYLQHKHKLTKASIGKLLAIFLIPLGLLLYMYYLQKTTGDSLAFYHVQKLFNQSRSMHIILPYQVFWRYLKMLFTVSRADPLYLTIILEFIVGVFFLFLSVLLWFRARYSYAIFNMFGFLIPTLTGNFVSLPRYVLICFPSFILLAQILEKYPKLKIPTISVFVLGFIVYLSLFVRGYWVS